MPKRKETVFPNVKKIENLIAAHGWSNAFFCVSMMGKVRGWISEWNRKDKKGNWAPKNLPSPEEAVRMCQLLNTTPEEILMHEGKTEAETAKYQEDIALVQKMIEEKREKNAEKSPAQVGEGLSPIVRELFDFIDSASDEEMADLIRYAQFLKSKR